MGAAEDSDDVSVASFMSNLKHSASSVSAVSAPDIDARSSRLCPPMASSLIRDPPLSWVHSTPPVPSDSRASSSIPPPKPAVRPFSTNRGPHGHPFDTPSYVTSERSAPGPEKPPPSTHEHTEQKRGRVRAILLLLGEDGARLRAASSNRCAQMPGTLVVIYDYVLSGSSIFVSFPMSAPCPMSQRRPALRSAPNFPMAAAIRQLGVLSPSKEDILSAVAPFFAL